MITPKIALVALAASLLAPTPLADTLVVSPGESVQAAIDAAADGDVVQVAPGEYVGDLDFAGKAITVIGAGRFTVLRGTGTGPVVTFDDGEGPGSVLDSVLVTGGRATNGGGVAIDGASPTIVRTWIVDNLAQFRGSGIDVRGAGAAPRLFNNVIGWNGRDGFGDPHAIQVSSSAAAVIVHNTIVRNDSNGLHVSGGASADVVANVFANNGSVVLGTRRGRGICDFTGDVAMVGNLFHRNRVGALLRGGTDYRRISKFENKIDGAALGIYENVDGRPGFVRNPPANFEDVSAVDLIVSTARNGRALDAAPSDGTCDDLDGVGRTIGHTGGPFADGSHEVPGDDACGVSLGDF